MVLVSLPFCVIHIILHVYLVGLPERGTCMGLVIEPKLSCTHMYIYMYS